MLQSFAQELWIFAAGLLYNASLILGEPSQFCQRHPVKVLSYDAHCRTRRSPRLGSTVVERSAIGESDVASSSATFPGVDSSRSPRASCRCVPRHWSARSRDSPRDRLRVTVAVYTITREWRCSRGCKPMLRRVYRVTVDSAACRRRAAAGVSHTAALQH